MLTTTTVHRTQSPLYLLLVVRLGGYIVDSLDYYSYSLIGKLTSFSRFRSSSSGIHQWTIHFLRTVFLTTLNVKVGSTLTKAAALRITLNIDGVSITSRTNTHPSHSQTSRLLTSSLSLGVPVPRATQCIRGV